MKNIYMGVIVPLTILLPIFVALLRYRRLDPPARVVLVYLCTSALVNVIVTQMAKQKINNLPLSHIYTVIEFVILAEFYKRLLSLRLMILIQVCFLFACMANAVFFQNIYIFNTYTRSLEALILMLFAVNYFAKLFTDISRTKLADMPTFWFNTALFLYFSGAFMLFIFSNYMLKVPRKSFNIVWNTHATFLLIMYLLFTIGFLKCKK